MAWRWRAVTAARDAEEWFDRSWFDFKRRNGLLDRFEILPYRGYGTTDRVFLRGRVLEESGITRSSEDDTLWRNLRNMVRRFASNEVAGARVRASFGNLRREVTADREGFFEVAFRREHTRGEEGGWRPVYLRLLGPPSPGRGPVESVGRVILAGDARFGVISDLDDTVLRSDATNVAKLAWTVLRHNAHTRLPFEGVAAFYEALRRGPDEDAENPLFYVSSSPWNIYDVLEDFLDVHGLPAGPLFLKDWSPTVLRDHEGHKLGTIRTLLRAYPGLPFVLIGDSGEQDPEIYHRVVRENPGRIRAVYIRDVTTPARDAEVHDIADAVRALGTEMALVPDTSAAAEHAASIGLIGPDAAGKVRAGRA